MKREILWVIMLGIACGVLIGLVLSWLLRGEVDSQLVLNATLGGIGGVPFGYVLGRSRRRTRRGVAPDRLQR